MQQAALFEKTIVSIKKWNLEFTSQVIWENLYVATLSVPSWQFIVKYFLQDNIISDFEILDYVGYLYITKTIIRNIKTLIQTIILKS